MHQGKETIKRRRFNSPAGLAWVACVFGLLVLANSGSAPTVPTIEADQQSGIRRTDLLRDDLSVAGREILQVPVDFDPGAVFPKHNHPGEEIVSMIEGLLEYEVEGKPRVTLKAGDVLFIPAGAAHRVKNGRRRQCGGARHIHRRKRKTPYHTGQVKEKEQMSYSISRRTLLRNFGISIITCAFGFSLVGVSINA